MSNSYYLRSISCNNEKEEIYLHHFDSSVGEKIIIFDKNIEIKKIIENFSIYDLISNYSNKIDFNSSRYSVFRDKSSQFVILEGVYLNELLICDLNSYSIIGSINTPFKVILVLNNKIVFSDFYGINYFIYKIDINRKIGSKYTCKSNYLLKPCHLYSDPH